MGTSYVISWSLIGAVICIVLSISLGTLLFFRDRRLRKKLTKLESTFSDATNNLLNNYYKDLPTKISGADELYLLQHLRITRERLRRLLSEGYAFNIAKTDIEDNINQKIEQLKIRLDEIEQRFPKEATLEKIASVNDAILGTQIEELSKTVREIKDKQLNRWDVVTVVFGTLAALGGVVGLISWIVSLFQSGAS